MTRPQLFGRALAETRFLFGREPEFGVALSVIRQLEYLVEVETGCLADRSRLKEIIGVQAAREVELTGLDLASLLHEVSAEAQAMEREQRQRGQGPDRRAWAMGGGAGLGGSRRVRPPCPVGAIGRVRSDARE